MGAILFFLGIFVINLHNSRRLLMAITLYWAYKSFYCFYGNYFRYDLDTKIEGKLALSHLFKQYALLGSLLVLLIGGKIYPNSQEI